MRTTSARDRSRTMAQPRLGHRFVERLGSPVRATGAVLVGSAGLSALAAWKPSTFVLAVGAVAAAVLAYRWARLLAGRDARGLLLLWLVFAVDRTAALVLPGGLTIVAQRLDDISLGMALVIVLVTGRWRRSQTSPGRAVSAGMAVFAAGGVVSALVGHVE